MEYWENYITNLFVLLLAFVLFLQGLRMLLYPIMPKSGGSWLFSFIKGIVVFIFKALYKVFYWILSFLWAVLVLCFDVLVFLFQAIFNRKSQIYGSADFLKGRAKRNLLSTANDGLVIDGVRRISLQKSFQHLCIVAPTGAGKTSRYIFPNVLNAHKESLVITDPSAEIYHKSAAYLEKQGYQVLALNVADVENSVKYNPLARATNYSDVMKVVDILVESAYPNSGANEAFWLDGAKSFLAILIKSLTNCPEEKRNLNTVRTLLHQYGGEQEQLDEWLSTYLDEGTFSEYKSFVMQDEKVVSGFLSTAKTALQKLGDPNLQVLMQEDNIDFEQLRTQKTALFLIVPEHELRYYAFLLRILYTQLFNMCMELPKKREKYLDILVFLDECGNIGKIPAFSSLITTLRKRNVSLSLVLQDIQQLVNIYGQADASTILHGGCANKIFYPGLSLKTCEELERILGKKTIIHTEGGYTEGSFWGTPKKQREREMGRSLLTADEIRTLSEDKAIFIHGNLKPVLLTTKAYFDNRRLSKRIR